MLLFSTLVAASSAGWPCTRLNWVWRNVWSTCSINSYTPANAVTNDHIPAHFRSAPLDLSNGPTTILTAIGSMQAPGGSLSAEVPNMICNAMTNTAGNTATDFARLRNRCRRAIDAYGGLVRVCSMTPLQGAIRGPISGSIYTNFAPSAEHVPHADNVAQLTTLAHRCTAIAAPGTWVSPANTCPGLLGWWGVVWNACGFRQFGPMTANLASEAQASPKLAPLGGELSPMFFYASTEPLSASPGSTGDGPRSPQFVFCSPVGYGTPPAGSPNAWNMRGPGFRTTRCRRALDQFGRTARRCGGTDVGGTSAPARGASDPLRKMMLGATAPRGLGVLAPLCN